MSLAIFTGAGGRRFVCDRDHGFGDAVAAASNESGAAVNSCAREKAAERFLDDLGLMSQDQLYACSLNCVPSCNGNCNPANRPGQSTHERRSDGVAYRGPVGRKLRYYERGIDVSVSRVQAFIHECAQVGYLVTQTYPGSVREAQHVNFRRKPKISLWAVRPLKRGMGRFALDRWRLRRVVKYLKNIQEPGERHPYLRGEKYTRYGEHVESAVKRFQRDHHMTADGVVGVRTYTVLKGTARRPPSRLDANGVEFLIRFEGEVLYAYNDPAGHATFGVGHLLHRGAVTAADARTFGTRSNPKSRDAMRRLSRSFLNEDIKRFERAVVNRVPLRWRKSRDRFTANVSASFNLGEGLFTVEAPLVDYAKALRTKSVKKVCSALMEYVNPGTPFEAGLKRRRAAECVLIRRNK